MPTVKMKCEGKTCVPLNLLIPLQGDLKELSEAAYLDLRWIIEKKGFKFVIDVWPKDGKYYVIDGHQRCRVLHKMAEDGWDVPDVPISVIHADTMKEAKETLLEGISQFGKVNEEGLYEFIETSHLDAHKAMEHIQPPDFDKNQFMGSYYRDEISTDGNGGELSRHDESGGYMFVVKCKDHDEVGALQRLFGIQRTSIDAKRVIEMLEK